MSHKKILCLVYLVAYTFSRVAEDVTLAVDAHADQHCYILPGVGNYSDQHFVTGPD